jgi:hypothetical protein
VRSTLEGSVTDVESLARARGRTSSFAGPQRASDHTTNLQLRGASVGARHASPCDADASPAAFAEGFFSGGGGASLGNTAKYSAIRTATGFQVDPETGEVLTSKGDAAQNEGFDRDKAKAERFALQSVARKLLPDSRTAKCLRWRQPNKHVEVLKAVEYASASYAGLQTCGSVWPCAICAAKVIERRRAEIIKAKAAHEALGGFMLLLTLTAPHQVKDDLVELLAMQAKALKYFNTDRSVRGVFESMGCVGQIRALEVTHGRLSEHNNGWHPHYHVLLFCGLGGAGRGSDEASMKDWSARLYLRWAACCERAGLGTPTYLHGLKLDDGTKAAAYVSKWGLEDEMTKGHVKKAAHGETPFDLLRAVLANAADKQAAALFVEFARAFKGKRQLHWSAGLKKRYCIGEVSDEELAARPEEHARLLGMITDSQWRDVLRVEGRAIVLQLAASGGWEFVSAYLDSISLPLPS